MEKPGRLLAGGENREMENAVTNNLHSTKSMQGEAIDKFGFAAVLIYLFIEYIRPQDTFGIGFMRPGLLGAVLLGIAVVLRGGVGALAKRQLRYLVFLCLVLIAFVPFAANNSFAYAAARTICLCALCTFGIALFVNTPEKLRTLIGFWVLIMLYLGIKGVLGKGIAGSSFLQDENDFSLLINMMLPFSISLFLYHKKFINKLLLLCTSMIGVVAVVTSRSRGGFVGLLCVFFVVWLFSSRKMAMLAVGGLLAGVLIFAASSMYWTRIDTTTQVDTGTAKERIESWKSAWNMFLHNPLGVGGGNFVVEFPNYQTSWFRRSMWGREAHSLWFTLISELGIEGIFIFGMLIYYNCRDILALTKRYEKARDDPGRYMYLLAIALIGSSAGYFSSGTFISVLYYPHYFYLTGIIVAAEEWPRWTRSPRDENSSVRAYQG